MSREQLRNAIITKSAELASNTDDAITMQECVKEYTDQFDEGSYCEYLRSWIGYMIEQGNKEAIDILKDIIRYRLATA